MKLNMLPAILGTLAVLLLASPYVVFAWTHGRFPLGGGEVLNWMFGL